MIWSGFALVIGFMVGHRAARPKYVAGPVVEAVRKVAGLAVVEIEVSDVMRIDDVRSILAVAEIPRGAPVRLHGKVAAGFDLTSGFTVDADAGTRVVTVQLPQPALLSIDDRVEWFNDPAGWTPPGKIVDRDRWTSWARGSLARLARTAGLLERTEHDARDLIVATTAALGWTAKVSFSPIPNAGPDPGLTRKR